MTHAHFTSPSQLNLKYFDTVPVSVGLNLLKNGMLFVPSEFGSHALYVVTFPFFYVALICIFFICSTVLAVAHPR